MVTMLRLFIFVFVLYFPTTALSQAKHRVSQYCNKKKIHLKYCDILHAYNKEMFNRMYVILSLRGCFYSLCLLSSYCVFFTVVKRVLFVCFIFEEIFSY